VGSDQSLLVKLDRLPITRLGSVTTEPGGAVDASWLEVDDSGTVQILPTINGVIIRILPKIDGEVGMILLKIASRITSILLKIASEIVVIMSNARAEAGGHGHVVRLDPAEPPGLAGFYPRHDHKGVSMKSPVATKAPTITSHVFNGTPLGQRLDDRYWEATALCRAFGKLSADFLRTKDQEEVGGLADDRGRVPPLSPHVKLRNT
jgi:hypothetical protein